MRKLFLSSAGVKPETKDEFLRLLNKDPKKCSVAFIPTACDPETNKTYVQWTIDQIGDLGLSLFTVDLKGEDEKSLYDKLEKADVICVNGGNTFYLLDQVRKSGFDKIINKLLDVGKVYFGVSAGSYIACPNIEASSWKHADRNVVNLQDLTALNLVNFLVTAHFEEKYRQVIIDGAKTTNLPVVALNDKQAIVVEGDKVKLVGDNQKEFFNGFQELE